MFQIDEKVMSDNRTLVTIQGEKMSIDPLLKNGSINYVSEGNNLWVTTPKIRAAYLKKQDAIPLYDKIVIARNGVNIDGLYQFDDDIIFKSNVEVKKNIVIRGDLTVEGNSSIIDTPSLSIEDNIIELNRNETGNGVTLRRSGYAIKRGTKPFARQLYDEDNKAFVLDTSSNMESEINSDHWITMSYAEDNGEYKAGELRARYRMTAPHGKFTDSLSVGNNTTLNNLVVNGTTRLNGATTTADMNINGILTANNSTILNGILTANRAANFKDSVNIDRNLLVKGNSTFSELATFNKGFNVVSQGATITGPVNIHGLLSVSENVSFAKDLSVGASATINNLTVRETTRTKNLEVTDNTTIGKNLSVNGNFTANKSAIFNKDVTINNGPLVVNSLSNFTNNVHIQNHNLSISSNGDNGNLDVGGNTLVRKDLTINQNLHVKGATTLDGNLNMTNSDIVARNIRATTNFALNSGDGKGIQFWQSDSYKIYMSNTQTSGLGGRLDSNSDYNMYFKMEGGSNRGFAFKSGNNVVTQIESTGKIRTNDDIISKGSLVVTRALEGHRDNGSGIDADKLDGLHGNDYIKKAGDMMLGDLSMNATKRFIGAYNFGFMCKTSNGNPDYVLYIDTSDYVHLGYSGRNVKIDATNIVNQNNRKIWHEDNDGHNSTLDADLLDGHHADYFATSTHNHDNKYTKLEQVDLKNKYAIKYNEEFDSLDFLYVG